MTVPQQRADGGIREERLLGKRMLPSVGVFIVPSWNLWTVVPHQRMIWGMRRPVLRLLVMPMLLLASCAADRGGGGPVHLKAENALGPYSGSVCAGDLCFVSGKIGMQDGTFEAEAESAISAVREELARSGLTLRDVLSATVYLTSLDLYHRFNRVYETRFSEPYPARAVVEVSRLPGGARVEIQAVARRSKR